VTARKRPWQRNDARAAEAGRADVRARTRQVRRTRELQRAARRRAGKPVVAVVGYTNAGKSSLVAALSRQPVAARDRRARRPAP